MSNFLYECMGICNSHKSWNLSISSSSSSTTTTTTTSILCTFPRVPFYVSFVPEPHLKQKRKKVAMLPIDDQDVVVSL